MSNPVTSHSDFRMDHIKRLFVLFQRTKRFLRHPTVQRSNALENSPLARLPTELLQQVANDLPVASAASFSLSCRPIYLLIGTQYIENLATSHHETLVFLNLLEHDLQNQVVCNSCRKLHRIRNAGIYTENGRRFLAAPPCLSADRYAMVTSLIHHDFSSIVFKMTMKHHYYFGNDAQSRRLLKLLSSNFHSYRSCALVVNETAECRIKNGSLFTCKRKSFNGTCKGVEGDSMFLWICPHLELESIGPPPSIRIKTSHPLAFEEKWSTSLRCENSTNIKKTSWDLCSEIQQCRYCRTEYKAGCRHDDSCTIQFAITIWKDLGQGPESEEWRPHLRLPRPRSYPRPVQFHGGEIASVFPETWAELGPKVVWRS